jgi:deoxyribonucleoside regulator
LEIEAVLEKRYNLFRAFVVETCKDYEKTKKNVGRAAAQVLFDFINDGDVIGIAWGTTLFHLVNSLPQNPNKKNISIIQIIGGFNKIPSDYNYNASELTMLLANKLDAECYQLFTPALVDSEEMKNRLLEDSQIKRTVEMFNKIDIAIVGIGTGLPKPSTYLYKMGVIKNGDVSVAGNSVGEINNYFYNKDGEICQTPLHKRGMAIEPDKLRKIRYVMGVAGGDFKANAIHGALKGRIINILVTDSMTAEKILNIE